MHAVNGAALRYLHSVPLSQLSGQDEHSDLLLGSSCILLLPFTPRKLLIKSTSLPRGRKF